jgi:hypothetical protein
MRAMTSPTLGEHFGRLAADNPDAPAITCASQMVTRGEL